MVAGSIIRLLRIADGKSQTDFAQELRVTRTYLSQVENDRKQPSLAFLRVASERLRVPLVLLVAEGNLDTETAGILDELRKILANILAARVAERRTDGNRGTENDA